MSDFTFSANTAGPINTADDTWRPVNHPSWQSEGLFDNLVRGIKTASSILLGNLAPLVRMSTLESWPEYVEARDNLFGRNWLTRSWLKWVLPHLRPAQYARLKEFFEVRKARLQTDFLIEVLRTVREVRAESD